jgi:hypothetical protein
VQIDMHYCATYAMARAAGLTADAARTIATCSQFVDDNTHKDAVNFGDGSRIDSEATAHHAADRANLSAHDQRRVWVPFHFLPGNAGETYQERLKCRIDSEIAQEMRDHHLGYSDRAFALEMMGITAHVYADTFSHYGFSGISSPGNRVDQGSFKFHEDVAGLEASIVGLSPRMRDYISKKADIFLKRPGSFHGSMRDNLEARVAQRLSGALGHGSVATYPDRPLSGLEL